MNEASESIDPKGSRAKEPFFAPLIGYELDGPAPQNVLRPEIFHVADEAWENLARVMGEYGVRAFILGGDEIEFRYEKDT